jgi:hypothetical protein
LNQLDLQSFLAKEVLGHGDVERRHYVATARVCDPDFLGLCVKSSDRADRKAQQGAEHKPLQVSSMISLHVISSRKRLLKNPLESFDVAQGLH